MKTIGLIGGMSWESTVTYYQSINETIRQQLGGLHSAKILLYSVDFHEIEALMSKNEWDKSAELLAAAAVNLEKAGADFILICTNTLHKVAPQVQAKLNVPLIHIAEATAEALKENGISKAALLGTKHTMKQDFYKEKLIAAGIDVFVPDDNDVELLNRIIFDELCLGIVSDKSKKKLLRIIAQMADSGAQGVILGCTEIGLIISQEDTPTPVFDTTVIHSRKAAMLALGK